MSYNPIRVDVDSFYMTEAIFFPLENQGNVYTSASVCKCDGAASKILISTRQERAYYVNFADGIFFTDDVYFKNISSSADILSLDVIDKNFPQDDFIIGITCAKKTRSSTYDKLSSIYFYIINGRRTCQESLPDNYFRLELNFIPYHLSHTKLSFGGNIQTVFLLSGGDKSIHMYQKCSDEHANQFEEASSDFYFPEFCEVDGITLCMDFMFSADHKKRCSAFSSEDGSVSLFNVEKIVDKMCIKAKRVIEFDYPSSSVKIFQVCQSLACPEFINKDKEIYEEDFFERMDVVLTNSFESWFISGPFCSSVELNLPQSECHDVLTCCQVHDIDFDGKNEILIGTYSQKVLIYKNDDSGWHLFHILNFPSPVHAIFSEDLGGDGVKQLVIVTMTGMHVYQHSPEFVSQLIRQRIMGLVDVH